MATKKSPEDAFYENLTLGLMKMLSAAAPRISNVNCEKRPPCEKAQVISWEQRHSVYLPEDMKKFYLSTDGFVLHWSYHYASDDIRRVGYIHFPHLLQVTLLRENIDITQNQNLSATSSDQSMASATAVVGSSSTSASASVSASASGSASGSNTTLSTHTNNSQNVDTWGNPLPLITAKTKIFELNNVNDVAKVCILYEATGTNNPKFYLLELNTLKWQFLADTFSEYLRMAIAHLGLPYWELCFSSFGLPAWTEQLFMLLAPHLLEDHETRRGRNINAICEHPYNTIDSHVFRAKSKIIASKSNTSGKFK